MTETSINFEPVRWESRHPDHLVVIEKYFSQCYWWAEDAAGLIFASGISTTPEEVQELAATAYKVENS